VRAEHENVLTELVKHERAVREREIEKRENQAESLELTVIEHHRKNTEDEPRGIVSSVT
jgi:hypothetical protein